MKRKVIAIFCIILVLLGGAYISLVAFRSGEQTHTVGEVNVFIPKGGIAMPNGKMVVCGQSQAEVIRVLGDPDIRVSKTLNWMTLRLGIYLGNEDTVKMIAVDFDQEKNFAPRIRVGPHGFRIDDNKGIFTGKLGRGDEDLDSEFKDSELVTWKSDGLRVSFVNGIAKRIETFEVR